MAPSMRVAPATLTNPAITDRGRGRKDDAMPHSHPTSAALVANGSRGGLRTQKRLHSACNRLELINRAIAGGVRRIETTSLVDSRKVSQLADAAALCAGLPDGAT